MTKIATNYYGYFYDIRHIEEEEAQAYRDGLSDIQNRRIDGFVIKNVLAPEEIEKLLSNIEKQKEDIRTKVRTGYTFPRAFAEADKNISAENPFENNFLEWQQWRSKFPQMFEVDVESRLTTIFSYMAGGKDVKILPGPGNVGCYTPLTIRVFHPNLGGIPVHCGNMFEELNPTLYADLISKVFTKNQMSFFILLQAPQRGGQLTLYDLEWEKGQESRGDSEIKLSDGSVIDTSVEGTIDKFFLKMNPGDMFIFAAGEIWHRVECPLGKTDRITLGGFLGFTKDGKSVTYWS
jgi:hypothetical protein